MSSENLNNMELTNIRDEFDDNSQDVDNDDYDDRQEIYHEDDFNEDDYDDDENDDEGDLIIMGTERYNEYMAYLNRVNEINAYNQRILAKQIEDDQRLANDPFYQAACALVREKSIEMIEAREKLKRDTFRNIVRRQMEKTCEDIKSGDHIRCEYEVIENLIDCEVDPMLKIVGVDIRVFYNNNNGSIYVFDGKKYHEFSSDIDMIQMMEEIKREIRSDTSITLYDIGFCKDVAGVISQYVC